MAWLTYCREGDKQPPPAFDGACDHQIEIVRYALRLVEVNGEPPDDEERHIRLGESFHEALVRVERDQLLRHDPSGDTQNRPMRDG